MSQVAINQVLSQMRALEAAAKSSESTSVGDVGGSGSEFGKMLTESIDKANATMHQAGDLKEAFTRGDEGVELPQVMVALQEASISFQAMTQVRNKLLSAYQDIMNMPV
ncbi:MAG: flagellar hook-basal body complex protein FliE [Gammaproteobacteria bacterium]|nr:flagellar hook-basal body complex protein FliE [Gammaproteobacteria bacterium]MBQ0839524.1 flagellar hook-basal body complex protein FliE [Gammaproteobacteria bacterium]